MKRYVSIILILVFVLALAPISAQAVTTINQISLTLDYPETGKVPPMTATWHTDGYDIHSIDWYDRTDGRYLETGEKIQADHQYSATLWVEVMDGYEFRCTNSYTPNVTATVNGTACQVDKAFEYNAWAMVCVKYYFSSVPAKSWIQSVNLTVPAPVAGEKPSYTQITGTGYGTANVYFNDKTNENMQNGIAWNAVGGDYLKPGQDTFAENTAYTFHCLVFPDDGYKIIEGATVYVNGKKAEATLDYDMFLSVTYTFPATGKISSTHTHFYTDWAWNSGQHYKNCTDCDEVFFVESHKGGVATCQQAGKCTVCGYAYLEPSDDYHVPDTSKWIARSDMYHYHKCTLCGAHCDIEDHRWSPTYLYQNKTGHAWICADCKAISEVEPHTPGPEATDTTPQTCKDCGYIIVPAQNHTHELTKVPQTPATCTEEGNIEYYTCSGCSDRFTDGEGKHIIPDDMSIAVGALGHTTSDSWNYDEQYHWRICTTCKAVLDETKMLHEEENGICTSCGYVIGSGETNTLPETPEETESVAPTEAASEGVQKKGFDDKLWIVILVASLVGVVALAIVIGIVVILSMFIIRKKKVKKNEKNN